MDVTPEYREAIKSQRQPAPPRKSFKFTPGRLSAIDKATDQLDLVSAPARLKILFILEALGEADVTALAAACGLSPSAVSEQLSKLKAGGMVAVRPAAQMRFYRRLPHPVADFALGLVGV